MRFYTLAVIVIIGLVSYRLARVIAKDKIGEPVRKWGYKMAVEHGKPGRYLNAFVTCPFCLSVWFSFLAVVWYAWMIAPTWPGWGEFLMAIPAAAGVAAILSAGDGAWTTFADNPCCDVKQDEPMPLPPPPARALPDPDDTHRIEVLVETAEMPVIINAPE